ncbi:uncharacterized protein PHACADRAFT_25092 [Phanerochaete carnosa HHB-10118-sp]|uniref:F-box domain-containing protein n=1 Tax=Phanerochaete carnosa (strain HHB-10118-sp) TaxID=650164 RepID=K5W4X3_PHACS|nr:uncharacterized protein PHACADRAFT_25092 [Phanerochaete carnosa HHB-10118-sp]EKM58943.1 hypothetical protein PHACADRAFT_25092 [Phanerochaete carnosa HHB-10118-sp]
MALSLDVVRNIIEQLGADEQLRTLLALSCTCKTICCYALNALWHKMSTLVPLLRCLPPDVWAQDELGEWMLVRPPWKENDWQRVHEYAARIQEIYVSEQGLPGLDVLPHLRIHLPRDTILFPNLRILYWKGTDRTDLFHYSSLLLGPSITDCSLESNVHGVVSTLHEMTRYCPNIKRLYISTSSVDVSAIVATYANLTSFKFFTHTPSASIGEPGLRYLGSLNGLSEWITNSPLEQESLRNITAEELRSFFPSLQILNLRGTDLHAVTRLLQHMKSRQLRKFTYTFAPTLRFPLPEDAVVRLTDALASYVQLDDLFLSAANHGLRAPFAALEGLTLLPIRRICLQNVVANNELNNESIKWLTQSWPDLEWFYCCNNDTPVAPRTAVSLPTPEIFCHFAQKCPRLAHLYLTVDTTQAAVPVPNKPLPCSPNPLYFHPHASLLSCRRDLWHMLEYITKIYPKLALRLSDDIAFSDPDTIEILDEIEAWIPEIVQRRATERRLDGACGSTSMADRR